MFVVRCSVSGHSAGVKSPEQFQASVFSHFIVNDRQFFVGVFVQVRPTPSRIDRDIIAIVIVN